MNLAWSGPMPKASDREAFRFEINVRPRYPRRRSHPETLLCDFLSVAEKFIVFPFSGIRQNERSEFRRIYERATPEASDREAVLFEIAIGRDRRVLRR